MDRIPWTAEETKILLDLVNKNKDWMVISQKIEKPVDSCQRWFHFLQNISKNLYPHYLSLLVLPIDIWPRVASFLDIHDILSLSLANHAIHKCVLENDFVWQNALVKRFPFYEYLREENVSSLGKNPFHCLLRKLVFGKFLVITNADHYWNSVAEKLVSTAGWNKKNIDLIIVSDLTNLKNLAESSKYDAVVLITNFGWPDDCFDELGNIIKKMIDDGTGIVSCVFCGCSWVETMGGNYMKYNCNPIVPNVLENNVEGSQYDVKGKMKPTNEEHFLTLNCAKDFKTTISQGSAHPEGTVLATLVTKEGKEYPLLVELKKWPGTILSVNTIVTAGESWKLVGNGILYVAKDLRENWENLSL